jgi:hypothetical protein
LASPAAPSSAASDAFTAALTLPLSAAARACNKRREPQHFIF